MRILDVADVFECFGRFPPFSNLFEHFRTFSSVSALPELDTISADSCEVAFISPSFDALFFVNRVVDILFVIDMVFNFFLIYPDESPGNRGRNIWVKDRKRIRKRYLKSWFIIDVVSVP